MPRDLIERLFSFITKVEDLEDEDGPITTGARLLGVADFRVINIVALQMQALGAMSEAEGKGSSSRSTSAP